MELWDACDINGRRLGYDLVRGEPVPQGVYHAVAEVAVRHADGSVLLTQRDFSKPTYPGCWELGAGGSILKGEAWLDGAKRELFEETGLRAERLTPLFVTSGEWSRCIYAAYLFEYDGPKDAIVLQEGETIGYRWLTPAELRDFAQRPEFVSSHRVRWHAFIQEAEGK
ncbi:MAG: NUDIX domain-containing protein [Clostridia bacterium]|nr:NUDIX domain-containing protein [Clostridia bacterium]